MSKKFKKFDKSDAIIFSKNRPWQLQQLLLSIKEFTDFNKIYIIYKSDSRFLENYEKVKNQFSKRTVFFSECKSIRKTFMNVFSQCESIVSFLVDDLVFYDRYSSLESFEIMKEYPILSYHFKLNSNYDFCHSVSKKQHIPKKLTSIGNHLVWEENDGTWDWYYPFDLTGTTYIKKDIKNIVKLIDNAGISGRSIKGPNDIEMIGAEKIFENGIDMTGKKLLACNKKRSCACISLNHVCSASFSPIQNSPECTIDYLNDNIFGKYSYDLDFFKNNDQKSVHINEYKLINI